uniref:F-box domain-containing protein n=1 Tax=Musca domestica TaxID=7370 RepID=A0A1I8M1G8_MUSDO
MVTSKAEICQIGRPHIMDLNDDCLGMIVRRLNVMQQYQISKLHTRFKQIVKSQWRCKLNHVVVYPELLENIDEVTFVGFMQEVGLHMQSLLMRHCDIRYLRLLSDQIFNRVETFGWMGEGGSGGGGEAGDSGGEELSEFQGDREKQFLDEDLNLLTRVFPKLQVLKLRGCQITGKYLAQFSSLKHLSLDDCQCLESDNFQEVFQELKLRKFDIMEDCDEINCCDLIELKKCPTLEHIKIADYHLCFDTDIINDILRMPNLKKLSIYSKNFVFDVLERISRTNLKQIVAFKFNGVLHNFERFFRELNHMRHLKKLSFYECRGYDIEGIRDHMLVQISKQFADLEEIHLCSCDLESDRGVLSFVQNCHKLKLINLTSCRKGISESVIWRCMELMKKQKWRTHHLEMWLKDTYIDKAILEDPRYMYNNRFLKLDFKQSLQDSNPPGVLKFTFST